MLEGLNLACCIEMLPRRRICQPQRFARDRDFELAISLLCPVIIRPSANQNWGGFLAAVPADG